jgi:hypothetical protein
MRQLRLLGLALMAVLALGVTAVTRAGATERGFLLLSEVKGIADTGATSKGTTTDTAGKSLMSCETLSILEIVWTEPGPKHFNLAKDISFHFTGCKSGAANCNTTGDAAGTLLLLMDVHLVNLLDKEAGKLIPGFFWLILNGALENRPIMVTCGVLKLELQGAVPGIVEPLNANHEITLAEEVTEYGMRAKPIVCDNENEKVCSEILKNEPFLMNFGNGFIGATMETVLLTRVFNNNLDVLWDD